MREIRGLMAGYKISQVINELSMTNDPVKQFNALDNIRWLAGNDHNLFTNNNWGEVRPKIVECVNNTKHEKLSINAMICIKDIFNIRANKVENDCDAFLPCLISRCTCKKSLSEPARHAIVAIATQCRPEVVMPKLQKHTRTFCAEGNALKCGWACYGIREALISMDSDYFEKVNSDNLMNIVQCIMSLLILGWEGVNSLSQSSFKELCLCLGENNLPHLEKCIAEISQSDARFGGRLCSQLQNEARRVFNHQG